jgi:type IV secretion system protein VirB6
MTDIVTQLFSAVDTAAANSIQTIYQSLTAGLQPVLVVAMTVYVAYWGLEMIFGRASLSAGAFVWKILKMALIWSLALGWSDFSTFVAQVFVHGGDGIATAVCTGAGGTNCSSAEASVSSSLSTLLANALAAAKVVASSGSGFSVVGLAILGLVLILLAVVFVSVGITLVLIGKVALFVLLGMAPFFISMALFGFTSSLFTGWMRTCAQYAIVPLIVYGILGFLLTIMNAAITNLASITDLSSGMTLFAPFMILCVVGIGLVPQSLSIAASIAGGHALHLFNPLRPFIPGRETRRLTTLGAGMVGMGALGLFIRGYNRVDRVGAGRSASLTPGRTTLQGGDPAAAMVASALLRTRNGSPLENPIS